MYICMTLKCPCVISLRLSLAYRDTNEVQKPDRRQRKELADKQIMKSNPHKCPESRGLVSWLLGSKTYRWKSNRKPPKDKRRTFQDRMNDTTSFVLWGWTGKNPTINLRAINLFCEIQTPGLNSLTIYCLWKRITKKWINFCVKSKGQDIRH